MGFHNITLKRTPRSLVDRGAINVASDFPTLAGVRVGDVYRILNDVTDNDLSKTATGSSFFNGDEIYWDGSQWVQLGNSAGGSLPPASEIGQVLFSENGTSFAAENPITGVEGWLVNNSGILIIQ